MFMNSSHRYTLVLVGGPKKVDKEFNTRDAAMRTMYDLIGRFGLKIEKIYDDKHAKTYICHDGSHFHINRI